jgi:hypothetical protein
MQRCLDARIEANKKLNLPINELMEKSIVESYDDVENGFFAIF